MATKKSSDQQANIAAVYAIETVAGTTAYTRFAFPFSIMDKMALVISRIEYWFTDLAGLNTSLDTVTCALIAGNAVIDIRNQADPVLIDSMRLIRVDLGAAASGDLMAQPAIKEFSSLPGGGIMVAPAPLCAAIQSSGAGTPMGAWLKLFYTYKELAVDEYWELVESRRIVTS